MNNITTTLTNLTNVTTITFEVENILILEILLSIPIFLILILVVFYCNKENIKRTCIVKNNKIIPYNYIDNYNSIIINTSTNSE